MAKKIVFRKKLTSPYFEKIEFEIDITRGEFRQIKKFVPVLQEMYKSELGTDETPFEISTAAKSELGFSLSAFNLKDKKGRPVECLFQGAKKFEHGGPFVDLIDCGDPKAAKNDERIKNSPGKIVGFVLDGIEYPNIPKTAFYDYIYIKTLIENPEIAKQVDGINAFQDIWFNPEKSLNCQAEAMAIYRGLKDSGNLEEATKDFKTFGKIVFGVNYN